MILKIKLGGGARGLLNYISQTNKTNHSHTRPFFSSMAGQTPRELAAEVASLRRLRPNLVNAVAHLSLSADPKDRPLTDAEWKAAITTALAVHGADQAAFAAYRHHDTAHDHTHVFFCESCPLGRSSATRITLKKTRQLRASLNRSST